MQNLREQASIGTDERQWISVRDLEEVDWSFWRKYNLTKMVYSVKGTKSFLEEHGIQSYEAIPDELYAQFYLLRFMRDQYHKRQNTYVEFAFLEALFLLEHAWSLTTVYHAPSPLLQFESAWPMISLVVEKYRQTECVITRSLFGEFLGEVWETNQYGLGWDRSTPEVYPPDGALLAEMVSPQLYEEVVEIKDERWGTDHVDAAVSEAARRLLG